MLQALFSQPKSQSKIFFWSSAFRHQRSFIYYLFKSRKLRCLGLNTLKVLLQITSKDIYHTRVYVYTCVHVFIYTCVHMCVHIYTMYTCISIHTQSTYFNCIVYDFNSGIQELGLHFCVYSGMPTVLGENDSFMANHFSV